MLYSTPSLIGNLPVETLAAIFLLTAPFPVKFEDHSELDRNELDDSTNFIFPGTLGAVSKTWHDIVVFTPSLWTSLRWKEGKHDPMLLALHIMRSKTLPLHLALFFDGHTPDRSLVAPSVDSIILPSMSRIATLHLSQPPRTWLGRLGRLTSTLAMSISWNQYSGPGAEVLLNKCRSLRRLSLNRGEDEDHGRVFYKLPRSLEELHLTEIPLDTSIKLFLLSPNVVKFSMRYQRPPHQELDHKNIQWWFSQLSTFENLEELTWDRDSDDWFHCLLLQASVPRLRRLCLISPDWHTSTPPMEEENQFFRRLPETLSTLELNLPHVFSPTDSPLFNHPSLETLILRRAPPHYVVDVFTALTPRENQKRLPKLTNLSILDAGLFAGNRELTPGDLQPIVPMLEQRLSEGDVFCLTFSKCALDWTPMIQGKLRGLREKGIQLQIIEDSDAVDWLE